MASTKRPRSPEESPSREEAWKESSKNLLRDVWQVLRRRQDEDLEAAGAAEAAEAAEVSAAAEPAASAPDASSDSDSESDTSSSSDSSSDSSDEAPATWHSFQSFCAFSGQQRYSIPIYGQRFVSNVYITMYVDTMIPPDSRLREVDFISLGRGPGPRRHRRWRPHRGRFDSEEEAVPRNDPLCTAQDELEQQFVDVC